MTQDELKQSLNELSDSDVVKRLIARFHLERDEVLVTIPDAASRRQALLDLELQALTGNGDGAATAELGWDKEDDSELGTVEKEELSNRRKLKEVRKLEKSIQSCGAKVSSDEVQSSMEDVLKLLEGD